jgi:hypothetical protein
MTNDTRFEVKLPASRRAALDLLADRTGVSASDWVRLAINNLLADQDMRPHSEQERVA